jgi:hypothetical protein
MHRYHLLKLLSTLFLLNILLNVYLSFSLYGLYVFMKNTFKFYTKYFILYLLKKSAGYIRKKLDYNIVNLSVKIIIYIIKSRSIKHILY